MHANCTSQMLFCHKPVESRTYCSTFLRFKLYFDVLGFPLPNIKYYVHSRRHPRVCALVILGTERDNNNLPRLHYNKENIFHICKPHVVVDTTDCHALCQQFFSCFSHILSINLQHLSTEKREKGKNHLTGHTIAEKGDILNWCT